MMSALHYRQILSKYNPGVTNKTSSHTGEDFSPKPYTMTIIKSKREHPSSEGIKSLKNITIFQIK